MRNFMRKSLLTLCLLLALVAMDGQSQEQSVSVFLRDLTRLTPGESLLIQPQQTLIQGNQPRCQILAKKTSRKEVELTVQYFCPASAPPSGYFPAEGNLPRAEPWYDKLARRVGYATWLFGFVGLLYWQRSRLARLAKAAFTRRK